MVTINWKSLANLPFSENLNVACYSIWETKVICVKILQRKYGRLQATFATQPYIVNFAVFWDLANISQNTNINTAYQEWYTFLVYGVNLFVV